MTNLEHPVLGYKYAVMKPSERVSGGQAIYAQDIKYLSDCLIELTLIELGQVPKSQRPGKYDRLRNHGMTFILSWDTFVAPDGWTYYDDDIVE